MNLIMFFFFFFNHIQLEEYKLFNPITQLTITTASSVVAVRI